MTDARGPLRWLEWSAPEGSAVDDDGLNSKVNPAARFTPAVMVVVVTKSIGKSVMGE